MSLFSSIPKLVLFHCHYFNLLSYLILLFLYSYASLAYIDVNCNFISFVCINTGPNLVMLQATTKQSLNMFHNSIADSQWQDWLIVTCNNIELDIFCLTYMPYQKGDWQLWCVADQCKISFSCNAWATAGCVSPVTSEVMIGRMYWDPVLTWIFAVVCLFYRCVS